MVKGPGETRVRRWGRTVKRGEGASTARVGASGFGAGGVVEFGLDFQTWSERNG